MEKVLIDTTDRNAICKAGWVFSSRDEYPGVRIYPAWGGALEGKRMICRDIRVLNGVFFLHNPWKGITEMEFGSDLKTVEAYILEHGTVLKEGANVWD